MNDQIKAADIEIMESWLARTRPVPEKRSELDFAYLLERNTFILCEVRPNYVTGKDWKQYPFAKIRYVNSQDCYNIYWQRANGKWIAYGPAPAVSDLTKAIEIIDADAHGCFYG